MPCYARQIDLILGDLFKSSPMMQISGVRTGAVIQWFGSHSHLQMHLQEHQNFRKSSKIPSVGETLKCLLDFSSSLSVAALTLQADSTRPDHVFLTFGRLVTQFQTWAQDSDSRSQECEATAAVLNSLEKRWKKADQDICRSRNQF